MRILVHLQHAVPALSVTPRQIERLGAALAEHELAACSDETHFLDALPGADAVIVWRFSRAWYERAGALRMVLTPAAGRELVEPDPSGRVRLIHGTFHGSIMAESLLAMMGFVNRRFGAAFAAQRGNAWDREGYSGIRRLAVQTALLIGYGHVGRRCADLLKRVGMTVHALKRDTNAGREGADRIFAPSELPAALAQADHVVCVLPGDTGTDGFLDAAAFAHMKPTAAVYNLGRGNAIDPHALREALSAGRIAAAFLDVVPQEPLPPDSPLWGTPNLYITPHVSAVAVDYLDLFFDEIVSVLAAENR